MSRPYDPDAPEGSKPPGASYVSKKDILWLGLILPVLAVFLTPFYMKMKEDGEKKLCSTNIQAIAKAIQAYSTLNDDRLPPIYEEADNGNPSLYAGVPLNWMSLVESQMSVRAKTICPSAKEEEHSHFYSMATNGSKPLSYGMYFPVAAMPLYQLSQPAQLILLTETTTAGARDTYNPVPFVYSDGKVLKDDGFIIGFDNKPDGNFEHSSGTKFVTRLAFPNTANGKFQEEGLKGRHAGGNHVIMADGSGRNISPGDALVKLLGSDITGRWRTR